MGKGALTGIFLALLIISLSGFVSAAAVSCEDLMASSGKSAETLCKVNYAGQCCNQDETSTDAPLETYDYYEPIDCAKNSESLPAGECAIKNQYYALSNEIMHKMYQLDNSEGEWERYNAAIQAGNDYYNTITLPKIEENRKEYEVCIAAGSIGEFSNCYDIWKAKFNAINLAEANYDLSLMKKCNEDLGGISSGGSGGTGISGGGGSAGSDTPGSGLWNENDNRGRDKYGRMMPSMGGSFGDAYVERADGTKVIPGRELYLQVDDSVKTGNGAKINIIFSQVGKVDLGPNTQLKVGSALLDQFYLTKGTLRSTVKFATPDKFEIDTPNAKVFVRGTEYVVDYNETTGTTTIYLNEGTLEISIANKNVSLTAGNYMIIYKNGTAQTSPLKAESWQSLGNNFHDVSSSSKRGAYVVGGFLLIELVAVVLLRLWTDRKIKNMGKKNNSSISKGIASLALAILGLIFVIAPYVGIIFSGIALSLALIQNANKPTKCASWGKVLAITGIILNILVLLIVGLAMFIFLNKA